MHTDEIGNVRFSHAKSTVSYDDTEIPSKQKNPSSNSLQNITITLVPLDI